MGDFVIAQSLSPKVDDSLLDRPEARMMGDTSAGDAGPVDHPVDIPLAALETAGYLGGVDTLFYEREDSAFDRAQIVGHLFDRSRMPKPFNSTGLGYLAQTAG